MFCLISFGFNSSPLAAYNIRMSEYIHKRHNVTVLLYHLVFPAKYRRAVVDGNVDETIRDVCLKIEDRYQLKFLEIGTDEDHVHFLVQSVPTYAVSKLVTVIKSITAREIFRLCPEVKKQLLGGVVHSLSPNAFSAYFTERVLFSSSYSIVFQLGLPIPYCSMIFVIS